MTSKTIERDEASILQMKAGDRVWHQSSANLTIQRVSRTTDKMVYVGGRSYWRAAKETVPGSWTRGTRRVNGHFAGQAAPGTWSGGYGGTYSGGYGRILRIATPEECAAWDREQEAKAKEVSDRNAAREAHNELLHSLTAAQVRGLGTVSLGLVKSVSVRDSEHGPRGTFDIVIGGLTEDQVRAIRIAESSCN